MNIRRIVFGLSLTILSMLLINRASNAQTTQIAVVGLATIAHSGPGMDSVKTEPEDRAKFDQNRDAAKDIANAILAAKKDGRRILPDVGGEWCIWCHRLDKFFDENTDVTEFLRNSFVVVKVNWSPENHNEKVLSRYPKIPGYPHLFVLDSDGTFLHSQDTGELESGKAHDHDKVFHFLKAWASKTRS